MGQTWKSLKGIEDFAFVLSVAGREHCVCGRGRASKSREWQVGFIALKIPSGFWVEKDGA
jgi:hypothetical protein